MSVPSTNAIFAIFVNGSEYANSRFPGINISATQLSSGAGGFIVTGVATVTVAGGSVVTIRNVSNGSITLNGGGSPPVVGASVNIKRVS